MNQSRGPNYRGLLSIPLLLSGCSGPAGVDLLEELRTHSTYAAPVCPEVGDPNTEKFRDLQDVQVFYGPRWELAPLNPITMEDHELKLFLWRADPDWGEYFTYLVAYCHYSGMSDAVEVIIPNNARYCAALRVKDTPTTTSDKIIFWCLPFWVKNYLDATSPRLLFDSTNSE